MEGFLENVILLFIGHRWFITVVGTGLILYLLVLRRKKDKIPNTGLIYIGIFILLIIVCLSLYLILSIDYRYL